MTSRDNSPTDTVILALCFIEDSFWAKTIAGDPFACLTTKVTQGLKRLSNPTLCVELDGVIPFSALQDVSSAWRKSGRSATAIIDINVYGHPHCAKVVGDILASAKLFLQSPSSDHRSLTYDNPQYLKLPGVSHVEYIPDLSDEVSDATAEASRAEIDEILDHLPPPKFLREVSVDGRITTALAKYVSHENRT
jgi:SWI/SNF-related matrix-associated actin-dependent regulator of chromatin subfamily A3